nr:CocE/NonD family hydrolase [Candidatus Sigynarchaeota archaeon]
MFSWLPGFFGLLGLLFRIVSDSSTILFVDLPVIATTMIVYLIAFYLNHVRYHANDNREDPEKKAYEISKYDKVYLVIGNAVIGILGTLQIYIALFIATYLLLVTSAYLRNVAAKNPDKPGFKVLGIIMFLFSPPVLLVVGLATGGGYTIIPVIAGMIVFLYIGQKYASASTRDTFLKYGWRWLLHLPVPVHYIAIGIILGLPTFFIVFFYAAGAGAVQGMLELSYILFQTTPMLAVNLPVVVLARWLYTAGFNKSYKAVPPSGQSSPTISKSQEIFKVAETVAMIIFGTLIVYLAILFAVHSFLMATLYFGNLKKRGGPTGYRILQMISLAAIPASFVAALLLYNPAASAIPLSVAAGLSFLHFYLRGQKYGRLDASQVLETFARRTGKHIPRGIKFFWLVFAIAAPAMIFVLPPVFSSSLVEKNIMLQMPDSIHLATDVYFSPLVGRNPAPVIFVRTPYDKDFLQGEAYATLYNNQGYHLVIQDFRGCFHSEGGHDFLLFANDYIDGVETINWIMNQSWCNGRIGSAGISALAITQFMYAGMNPAGLKAQSIWFGCPDLYADAIMEGAYHQSSVETWLYETAQENWRFQLDYIFDHMRNMNWSVLPYNATTLNQPPGTFEEVNVRALHVGGWYDHFLNGTIRGYMGYDDRGMPNALGHQKLILGPWTHGAVYGGRQGDLYYPANSDGLGLILKWETEIFDEALRDIPADWSGNRVAYYLMGDVDDPYCDANYWKYAADWPLNYTWNEWYFGLDGNGSKILVNGTAGIEGTHAISYLYDPRDPVPTRGGNNQPGFDTAGPQDQRDAEERANGTLRDDVLLFQSDILDAPYTFEGNMKAKLCIASNCTDTDFVVKLCDVYPDGRRMLVIDSALTTRFRDSLMTEHFLTPGQEYNITVDLFATAYQFNKGHRIGIVITSSNYDRYAINPNTGGDLTDHFTLGFVANNTIITGPGKSCIYFPVLNE